MGSVIANSTPLIALAKTKWVIKKAWDVTKILIDIVERYNGVITILWHNTYMVSEMLKFYEKILKYCNEKGVWMTSGEEIWTWWRKEMITLKKKKLYL